MRGLTLVGGVGLWACSHSPESRHVKTINMRIGIRFMIALHELTSVENERMRCREFSYSPRRGERVNWELRFGKSIGIGVVDTRRRKQGRHFTFKVEGTLFFLCCPDSH